jgi:hypothetical protein
MTGTVPQRHRQRHPQPGAHRALAGITLVTASLATAGTTSASPISQLNPYVSSPLCSGVRPSQVAAIVGHPVPAPTAAVNSSGSMGIIETDTLCTYAQITSLASMQQEVGMAYVTLSKVPARSTALSYIEQAMKKAQQSQGTKWTYTINGKFGVTNIYAQAVSANSGFGFTLEFAAGWKGKKIAEAIVFSALPQTKVYALEKLAINNFGV